MRRPLAGAAAPGPAAQGNLLDWADKALGQGISTVTRSVKNLLSGARQAPVAAALEALMDGRQVRGGSSTALCSTRRVSSPTNLPGALSSHSLSLFLLLLTPSLNTLSHSQGSPEWEGFAVMDPKLPPGRAGLDRARGPFREALVFMIGGGNYLEREALAAWAGRSQPARQVRRAGAQIAGCLVCMRAGVCAVWIRVHACVLACVSQQTACCQQAELRE